MCRHSSDAVSYLGSEVHDPLEDLESLAARLRARSFLYDDPASYEAGVSQLVRALVEDRARRAHPAALRSTSAQVLGAAPSGS